MRICEVLGTVTLNRCHPTFIGARLRIVRPLSLANLRGEAPATAEPIVAWEERGAGLGQLVAVSDGAEAAQPFRPENKPVDAYSAAILDSIDLP